MPGQKDGQKDGWKDGQTPFYRTLPAAAAARDPINTNSTIIDQSL